MAPKEQVLSCEECHSRDGHLANLEGFYLPLQLLSGLLYYYYNDWVSWGFTAGLDGVAFLHTAMAFVRLLFLLVHIYLTTTGGSLLAYIQSMITGWEEVEEDL